MLSDFQPWIDRWGLQPDGEPFITPIGNRLLPVRQAGKKGMLKVALHVEERRAGSVMAWFRGEGAARVFAHDDQAVLLERLDGPRSLAAMARNGEDESACHVLCATVRRLHVAKAGVAPPLGITPLESWFSALWPQAELMGGLYARAANAARDLLERQQPPIVLHGDIHHDNVLDGGPRGWLAIDPKGLFGDPGYDYANLVCNPDAPTALANLDRRIAIVVETSGLPRDRVLMWLIAYLGLSASWTASSGSDPSHALAIAEAVSARI